MIEMVINNFVQYACHHIFHIMQPLDVEYETFKNILRKKLKIF